MANLIVPPAIPTLTVGGRVFTDLSNLIVLYGYASGTTTIYCSLRLATASAGYQVTSGKTLRILALEAHSVYTTAAAANGVLPGYTDDDVGMNSSTVGTNRVSVTAGAGSLIFPPVNSALAYSQMPIDWRIPATKYPGFVVQSATLVNIGIRAFGYEV